ncbi:MAG: CerR family C-terminal domain-containing protein [Proteobacteria bacterium]|nr:CerR family C-terminal domain-containing protein [Pseudomonadota bacterium]MBU1585536.1 CerR family C-terminal domain-containing protein [Pseudomonadota bacterium]MBU2452702.1 CerR family C-terminal domain-containing protein [Pseudomonadota bacterium]MBU2630042.1 CerR family C-terminal domain-containing protein [Pseudomonadota bacterium]
MTKPLPTKQRIIDVAGEIFGKHGFKSATIRKIAIAANANIASINYHFRDKEGLYRAVLEDIFSTGFKKFPSAVRSEKNSGPDQRLHTFIRAMFHRFLSMEGWQGISGGRGRLITREFFDPTPAFEDIVDTYIKPQKDILVSILSDLSHGNDSMNQLLPCAISIIGQCVYYAFAEPIIKRLAKDFAPTQDNLDRLADHVFLFSLGGLQQINKAPVNRLWDDANNREEKL